jgi:protoheme ferro-lyase
MVFLNMGGPSTLDEVGDFLSRLFVSVPVVFWFHSLASVSGSG